MLEKSATARLYKRGDPFIYNWYAYDGDTVFLPKNGSDTINLGATQDDVTHITALQYKLNYYN